MFLSTPHIVSAGNELNNGTKEVGRKADTPIGNVLI
jgi:hypothetical protein